MRVNDSDLCAIRTVGVNLSIRMRIVWRRAKVSISGLLGNAPSETRISHALACRLPYEITEMIIFYIAHDLGALKAVSLTCRSWYIVAVPHIHHTLILTIRDGLAPLSKLHQLGLMPLVEEIRVYQSCLTWLWPQTFGCRDLRYFSAFTNIQTLVFDHLELPRFMPRIKRYFGQFSPTLRSIALLGPFGTPRQLSYFLSLFPNLDDIAIWEFFLPPPDVTIPDTGLVPFSIPRLRGRLVLHHVASVETWTPFIASGSGPQFHSMDLCRIGGCAPVLFGSCAETLEMLRFYVADPAVGE